MGTTERTAEQPKEDLTVQIVRRLSQEGHGLSRNKNFQTFQHPFVQRARRIHRHLHSLTRDIRRFGRRGGLRVERRGNRLCVVLVIEPLQGRREAYLTPWEYEILQEDPLVRSILSGAEGEAGGS